MFVGRFFLRQLLRRATRGRVKRAGKAQSLLRLPTLMRLGYALLRDPRVPIWQRTTVLGLLGLVFSPVDVVQTIPVVGQFWDVTVAVLILETFIQVAPAQVVNEHIQRLRLEKKIQLRKT